MRILLWIVRILAVLLLIRMVLRAFFPRRGAQSGQSGARRTTETQERLGGELVRDPHCGTYIPKARAVVKGSAETALYFCSTECRDAYDQHPS